MLGSVPWSMHGAERQFTQHQFVTISQFFVGKCVAVRLAFVPTQAEFSCACVCQGAGAGFKVRMDMRLEHIPNPQTPAIRIVQVGVNIALRIDDGHDAAVANNVGILRKPRNIKTLKNHDRSPSGKAACRLTHHDSLPSSLFTLPPAYYLT